MLSTKISYEIGQYFKGTDAEGSAAHILAHTVLGAAVAAAGGNDALSAGLAAGGSEAAAPVLSHYLYGKDAKDLNKDEKSTISSIVGLAGSAVGATTADVSSTVQGGQSAQNAVENNSQLGDDARKKVKEFFNRLSAKAQHPIDQGAIQGVGSIADGLVMIADAFGDTAVSAVHCPQGSSACGDAMENNRQKGQAVIDFLTINNLKQQAAAIEQSYIDLNSGESEKVANAQRVQAEVFTSLGLGTGGLKKLGANNASDLKLLEQAKASELAKQKETIKANIAESQKAREASNFKEHLSKEELVFANKAEQELISEINKFKSNTQAEKVAAMIGAYDPKTGKTAVGFSNKKITADSLHPTTVSYIEKQLGVKIGEFTAFCKNKAGACAEVSAADSLIRQGTKPENIKFTDAIRPKVFRQEKGNLKSDKVIVETCGNCKVTWPKGAK